MSKSRDFENSKKDKMADRRMARKRKMSLREWEDSPEDQKMDSRGFSTGGSVPRGMGVTSKGGRYSVT